MASELEALFIGDLHLDNGLASLFPNYDFDPNSMVYKSVAYALDCAKEEGIKTIVFLGDVFHNPFPSQKQQNEFLVFLLKYPKLDIHIIAGNHDYSTEDELSLEMSTFTTSISSELSHVNFYTKPTLKTIQGVPFSFLPWPHSETLEKNSVNIAHIEVANSVSDNGKVMAHGYDVSKNALYIIGHLHRRQMYKNRIYYPGTLFQRTFGEPLPKGFARGTITYAKRSLEWDIQWINFQPPYELHNLRINEVSDFKLVTKPDPNKIKQYKLFIRKGIEIPPGFLDEYPNVLNTAGKLSVKEIRSLETHGFEIEEPSEETVNLLDNLDPFLAQQGLTQEEIKIARRKYIARYQGKANDG